MWRTPFIGKKVDILQALITRLSSIAQAAHTEELDFGPEGPIHSLGSLPVT